MCRCRTKFTRLPDGGICYMEENIPGSDLWRPIASSYRDLGWVRGRANVRRAILARHEQLRVAAASR